MYGVLKSCLFALVSIQIELQRNFKHYCAAYTQNFMVCFVNQIDDAASLTRKVVVYEHFWTAVNHFFKYNH